MKVSLIVLVEAILISVFAGYQWHWLKVSTRLIDSRPMHYDEYVVRQTQRGELRSLSYDEIKRLVNKDTRGMVWCYDKCDYVVIVGTQIQVGFGEEFK